MRKCAFLLVRLCMRVCASASMSTYESGVRRVRTRAIYYMSQLKMAQLYFKVESFV